MSILIRSEWQMDPLVECYYRVVSSETENFFEHYHDYYELFLMLDDGGIHIVNGAETAISAKTLVFIRPDDVHYFRKSDKPFSFFNIVFSKDTMKQMFDYLGDGFPSDELLNAENPPSTMLSQWEFEDVKSRAKDVGAIPTDNPAQLKTGIHILIFDLMTKFFYLSHDSSNDIPLWLTAVCNQMRRSGNFVYGTQRMVELSGRSREHLARSLKKYMNITTSEYVNQIRLDYISNMLLSSNKSITDIVEDSGFESMSYASQLFRKRYSMTMRDFRLSK